MKIHLRDASRFIDGEMTGNPDYEIFEFSSLSTAKKGSLTFYNGDKQEKVREAVENGAVIICKTDIEIPTGIKTEDPYYSFVKLLEKYRPEKRPSPCIKKTSVIGKNVKIQDGVYIGNYVTIGDNVEICENTIIEDFTFIDNDVRIGKNCLIEDRVTLKSKTEVYNRVIIHSGAVIGSDGFGYIKKESRNVKIPQIGGVVIEDDVEIGANTTIDRSMLEKTVIGSGTKIDNLVQIAHNVRIGKNCLIASQVGISGSTNIGDNVMLAGQVGIADHINIGNDVIILAKSGVSGDVPDGQILFWIPAIEARKSMKIIASLKRVPELLKKFRIVERKVKELEEK